MPRSNSSFGVADGGEVVSAPLAPGPRGGRRNAACAGICRSSRRYWRDRAARRAAPAGAPTGPAGDRQLAAAERARRAGRVRVLAGIEGIAAAARRGRGAGWLLDDRRGRRDLLLLVAGCCADSRLGPAGPAAARADAGAGRTAAGGTAATLGWAGRAPAARRPELPQPLFELAVAVLQFLVLAGELSQLVFKPLDAHFGVGIIGLRRCLRRQRQHRGNRRGAGKLKKSG